MSKIVNKAWGKENWIVNSTYCGKILTLKRGYQCSFHCHKLKDETFYVYRGKVLMRLGSVKMPMKQGDSVRIRPNVYHQFTGMTDAEIIEFSTKHRDSDTYRKSESGRVEILKAYDYDGVVTKGVKMQVGAPIITGRSFEEVDRVKTKGHPVYFNPKTYTEKNDYNSALWKAEMIKRLGIEEFYEDNSEQAEFIQNMCSNCSIVKV
jgi:mannose-6-phosphate isomerase-like protein (cupin superfamily)